MNITLFGSTGMVGKAIIKEALNRQYHVTVLARSPEKLGDLQAKVTVVKGDYFDAAALEKVITDQTDAVLSTIGPQPKATEHDPSFRYGESLKKITKLMNQHSIKRIITVSGAGTIAAEKKVEFKRKFMRFMLNRIGKHILETKTLEYKTLAASNVDWTVVRPPMIKDGVSGSFTADAEKIHGMKVDTDQLATFMLNEISSDTWVKRSPLVATV